MHGASSCEVEALDDEVWKQRLFVERRVHSRHASSKTSDVYERAVVRGNAFLVPACRVWSRILYCDPGRTMPEVPGHAPETLEVCHERHDESNRQHSGDDPLGRTRSRGTAAAGAGTGGSARRVPRVAARSRAGAVADQRARRPPRGRHVRHQPRSERAVVRHGVRVGTDPDEGSRRGGRSPSVAAAAGGGARRGAGHRRTTERDARCDRSARCRHGSRRDRPPARPVRVAGLRRHRERKRSVRSCACSRCAARTCVAPGSAPIRHVEGSH